MSERKEPKATRYDREIRRVVFKSDNTYRGLKLGDLRQVVAAAEGMADEAEVTVESLTKHWQRADEWTPCGIRITEELRLAEQGEVENR